MREATLPSLIEAVKRLITDDRKRAFQDRGSEARRGAPASAGARARRRGLRLGRQPHQHRAPLRRSCGRRSRTKTGRWCPPRPWSATGRCGCGISTSTISTSARRAGTASATARRPRWARRWPIAKYGRLSVNIQNDGDLMYAPGRSVDRRASPDSAAQRHAQQPRLSSGSDARAAHGRPAQPRHRPLRHRHHDHDPTIDFAKLAQGLGVYGEGPITDPKDLGPAIQRALEVVKRGEPALVDVVTQPR